MKTYKIVRFYKSGTRPRIIRRGLSLKEAQEHCQDPSTFTSKWFDRYQEEIREKTRIRLLN